MEEKILVILNFSGKKRKIILPEKNKGKILLSTHRCQKDDFMSDGIVAEPFEATLVKYSVAS